MAEINTEKPRVRRLRHKGRSSQVLIYLGKQMRFFINESDWKVLPMAAVIAALVGMVIRLDYFQNMEGSLFGSFALTCVAIWNGCFNSIQAVCRERAIIKREHRSGMHISSYVAAHMIYQFFLCLAQTGLSMYVLLMMGVQFPLEGFMTPWIVLDISITMLLVTYASDMMSLFISSISHTTTGAMTVMPFVLIFQLVFSGGLLPLPEWSQNISNFTISNYGFKALTAQTGYNEQPMVTAWEVLLSMRDSEVGGTVTIGQLADLMDTPAVEKRRDMELMPSYTVSDAADILSGADEILHLRDKEIVHAVPLRTVIGWLLDSEEACALTLNDPADGSDPLTLGALLREISGLDEMQPVLDSEIRADLTLGEVLDLLHTDRIAEEMGDVKLNDPVTLGDVADFLKNNEAIQARRDDAFTLKVTVGDLFDLFGEDEIREIVQTKTAAAARKAEYDRTEENIVDNWISLALFVLAFAMLATLALEMIDKDKR